MSTLYYNCITNYHTPWQLLLTIPFQSNANHTDQAAFFIVQDSNLSFYFTQFMLYSFIFLLIWQSFNDCYAFIRFLLFHSTNTWSKYQCYAMIVSHSPVFKQSFIVFFSTVSMDLFSLKMYPICNYRSIGAFCQIVNVIVVWYSFCFLFYLPIFITHFIPFGFIFLIFQPLLLFFILFWFFRFFPSRSKKDSVSISQAKLQPQHTPNFVLNRRDFFLGFLFICLLYIQCVWCVDVLGNFYSGESYLNSLKISFARRGVHSFWKSIRGNINQIKALLFWII